MIVPNPIQSEMTPNILEKIKSMPRFEIVRLAKKAGLPWMTVYKIKTGQTLNPRIQTLLAFDAAMKSEPKRRKEAAHG